MLGSHNTLTCCPCPWYQWPLNVFSKCQSKTITEQLEAGVRFFDLRVKVRAGGEYAVSHGLVTYYSDGLLMATASLLDYTKGTGSDVYYRVMLEYNSEPKRHEEILSEFKDLVNGCRKFDYYRVPHKSPHFCGAYQKWDYACVIEPDDGCDLPITHRYSSCIGWKRFIHCIPYLYAKRRNAGFKEECKDILSSDNAVLLLDFV